MLQQTFLEVCDQLAPTLQHQNNYIREAIPVQKLVATAIWKLATPDSYRSLSNQFGVGKSAGWVVVAEICEVIGTVMYPKVMGITNVPEIIWLFENRHSKLCWDH